MNLNERPIGQIDGGLGGPMAVIKELTNNLLGIEIIYIRKQETHESHNSLEKPG